MITTILERIAEGGAGSLMHSPSREREPVWRPGILVPLEEEA